jgi:predicted nuclease with TOPRIM domain
MSSENKDVVDTKTPLDIKDNVNTVPVINNNTDNKTDEKIFTQKEFQAQLDRVIKDRFGDYKDLKEKVTEYTNKDKTVAEQINDLSTKLKEMEFEKIRVEKLAYAKIDKNLFSLVNAKSVDGLDAQIKAIKDLSDQVNKQNTGITEYTSSGEYGGKSQDGGLIDVIQSYREKAQK